MGCTFAVQAQKKFLLTIISNDTSVAQKFQVPDYIPKFDSPAQRTKELQNVLFSLYNDAYLAATFDSLVKDSLVLKAYLNPGSRYQWAFLHKGNADEGLLSQFGFREKMYTHKPFYYKDALKLMDRIVSFYENHGYPFAQVHLDSIKFSGAQISASLNVQKNRMETIDSIEVKGNLKLSAQYLYGYLGIKPGDLYDESKVRAISGRLKALSFLFETKPLQVIFTEDKVKIFLYLGKRSSDQFNGIVGILPNSQGKINITGDLSLQLQNSFHHAEEVGFHWQHVQAQTENLTIHFSYPYLLKTPLGVDEDFKLFKQDTTYIQLDEKIGLKYLLIGGNYWKVFYEDITSTLLSTSALQYQASGLPDYADITTGLYGIEYKATGLDYIYNPRKGYSVLVDVAAGIKQIHENARLNPQIYEGLQLKSTEYKGNIIAAYYIPFMSRSTVKLAVNGGYIDAPSLLRNDLYRIGGFTVLRGFDEQSIYANAYSVGTIEFHYLLEQNSFMFLFFDQGWYTMDMAGTPEVHDMPYGFGTGMDFQTKAGIFSISYALGSQFKNPISFRDGKISFGIVNYF